MRSCLFGLLVVLLTCCGNAHHEESGEVQDAKRQPSGSRSSEIGLCEVSVILFNDTEGSVTVSCMVDGVLLGRSFNLDGVQSNVVWPTHAENLAQCLEPGDRAVRRKFPLKVGTIVALSLIVADGLGDQKILTSNQFEVGEHINLHIVRAREGLQLQAD